jgi:hypothetical protein
MKLMMTAVLFLSLSAVAQTPVKTGSSPEPIRRLNIKARVVPSSKDTANVFANKLDGLESDLRSEKNLKKRYDIFGSGVDELSKVNETGPRPDDEQKALEMALVVDTLDSFPMDKNPTSAKCKDQYAETSGKLTANGPPEPGVQKGLAVLKLVCGN